MKYFIKLASIVLLTPLFVACSSGPSESTVKTLIEAQYEQAESIMDSAMTGAGENMPADDSGMADAMKGMLSGMMPKLESIESISCDSASEKNTYRCTAEITQTIMEKSSTNKSTFLVHKVNDEWVLGN